MAIIHEREFGFMKKYALVKYDIYDKKNNLDINSIGLSTISSVSFLINLEI
tara:strand:- start:350 stop:502 length:153 start_codon:yes stop_codon:yes gene_type:complete